MQTISIGRDPSNIIVLSDSYISRYHAKIFLHDNGTLMIQDLGSTNGTFVNGERIGESYLKPGDILKCGNIYIDWEKYIDPLTLSGKDNSMPDHNSLADSFKKSNKKKLLLGNYSLIALLFLLPFCDIKCGDQVIKTVTGLNLMTGTNMEIDSGEPFDLSSDPSYGQDSDRIKPSAFIIIAFFSAISGFILLFTKYKNHFKAFFLLSLAGLISMFIFIFQIHSNIKDPITISFKFPFWLVIIGFISSIVISYLEGFQPKGYFKKNSS